MAENRHAASASAHIGDEPLVALGVGAVVVFGEVAAAAANSMPPSALFLQYPPALRASTLVLISSAVNLHTAVIIAEMDSHAGLGSLAEQTQSFLQSN